MLVGCSNFQFPGVHQITIQQGNVITQKMIDKLKPGMTKSQVKFVLGTPVVDDSFSLERWDYIYSIQFGDNPILRKVLSVHFVDEQLSHFEGNFIPTVEVPDKAETPETPGEG